MQDFLGISENMSVSFLAQLVTDEYHGEDPPKNRTRQRTMMMPWWCVAMIINAFERQQEIKELYQDDAYTILHITHELGWTYGQLHC